MDFIYKILCKFNYHVKTRLLEVTLGFGASGKIEKIQCKICNKIYIQKKNQLKLHPQIIVILILLFLILLFIL